MKNTTWFIQILLIPFMLIIIGCNNNFFDTTPSEITGYSPESDVINQDFCQITVNFSKKMEKSRVQTSFSFLEDSSSIQGNFQWSNDDKTMTFTHQKTFLLGKSYTFKIADSAEDVNGNNLKKSFSHSFRLGNDSGLPYVITGSCAPQPNSSLGNTQLRQPIIIVFSEPMNKRYPQNNLTLSPSISGIIPTNLQSRTQQKIKTAILLIKLIFIIL